MPVHAQPTHAGRRLSKAGSGGWERSGGGPVDFPAPYPGAAHPGRPWGAAGGGALKESDQRSISPARRFPPLPHLREFEPNPTLPARFASPPPPDRPWPPGGGHLLSSQIAEPDPAFLRSRLADAELALARQEIDGLRRQVSTKQARIAELEEQVSESAVYAKELRSLQRQVDTKQDRIDALESTGNGAKALQWKNDDLQEQLSSANTRIAELKASLRLAETGKQKAAEDLDSVLADTQRAMTLRTEQANVQVALDELRVRHKEMLASALEDINAANAKLTEQEACVDDLRRQLAAEKKLAAIDEVGASRTHRELQGAYDTIRELEAERDRERLKSETTRLARVDEKSGIDGTIKLREMESLHRTMTHEVDMTRQDAERYKSEAHKYKAEYEKHKEEAERLLVDNLKCKAAADRWKSEAEHSRDDAAAKHRSELASRKEECDRLQADCDKARSDLARARAESAEADRLRREAEETRDQRKSEADGLRDEADKLRADANRCKQEADRAKRAHDDLLASNGRAESNECARLKDELQKLKAEGSALRREATAGKGELDRLQNEADAQEFELTRHKDEASRLRTDHARAAAELHRVKLELDHARKLATDAEAETQRLRLAAQTAPERSSMVVTQSSVHNPAVPQQQPVAAGYAEEELLRLAAELRRVNRLKEDALSELDAAQHAAAKAKKAHEAAVSEAEAAEGKVAGLKRAIDDLRADNAELALHLHRAKAAAQEALEEADVASRMLLDARRLAEEAREQLLLNTSRVKRDAEQAEAALHGALAASEAARRGLEASLHESEAVNAATRAKLMEVDRDLSAAVRAATRAEDDLAAEKHRFGLSQAGAADAHAIELNHLRIAHETALTQAEDAARAARREASATQELLQRTTMHFDDQLAKAIRQCEARMELAQHGYDEDVGRARRQKDEAQLAFDAQVQALREACEAQLAGASADLAATRAELQSVVTERDSTREQLVSTQIALAKLQNHAEVRKSFTNLLLFALSNHAFDVLRRLEDVDGVFWWLIRIPVDSVFWWLIRIPT
ncbi:hypothetical protein DIPPA_21721 [Diplonema papillatum]|nr:hypothetical protein DIPPA_21721 [Diplonema papillatum]